MSCLSGLWDAKVIKVHAQNFKWDSQQSYHHDIFLPLILSKFKVSSSHQRHAAILQHKAMAYCCASSDRTWRVKINSCFLLIPGLVSLLIQSAGKRNHYIKYNYVKKPICISLWDTFHDSRWAGWRKDEDLSRIMLSLFTKGCRPAVCQSFLILSQTWVLFSITVWQCFVY